MQENELEIKKIPASSHCLAPAKRIGCTKFCDLFCTRSNSLTFGTFYHFQYYTITVCIDSHSLKAYGLVWLQMYACYP